MANEFIIKNGFYSNGNSAITGSLIVSASGATNDLQIGTNKLFVSASGNVGIGTTTPTAKLDVNGSYRFGPTTNGSVYFRSWDYGTDMDISSVNAGGWARTHRIITSDTGGAVYFGVYGNTTTSERAYWTIGTTGSVEAGNTFTTGVHLLKNGNVGIGTYVPTAKLHITNTSTSASFIVEDDTQTDATPFIIDNTGSVGIGTLTPYSKLTVQTSGSDDNLSAMIANFGKSPLSTAYGSTFIRVARYTTTSTTSSGDYTDIDHNSAGSSPHRYGTFGDTNIINGNRLTSGPYGNINFITSGSTRMTIAGGTSAGNVGIGITVPTAKLHINHTGSGNSFLVEDDTNPDTTPFVIDSIGSVGIGTTTPTHKLHLYNDAYTLLLIERSGSFNAPIQYTNAVGTMYAGLSTNAKFTIGTNADLTQTTGAHLVVSASGNVGIGTTTPNARLDISGSAIIVGSMVIGSSSLGPSENTLTLGARDNVQEGGQLGFNAAGGTYTSASFIDLYQNRLRILKGTNASSTGEAANWNMHNLQMGLPAYTSAAAFPGTPAGFLAFDSSGNIITDAGAAINIGNTNLTITSNATRTLSHAGTSRFIITGSNSSYLLELQSSTTGNGRGIAMNQLINAEPNRFAVRATTAGGNNANSTTLNGWASDHLIEYVSGSAIAPSKLKGWSWSYFDGSAYQDVLIISTSNATTISGSLTVTGGITGSLQGTASFANTASFVNPLNQAVSISGSLKITGSLIASGGLSAINTTTTNQSALIIASTEQNNALEITNTKPGGSGIYVTVTAPGLPSNVNGIQTYVSGGSGQSTGIYGSADGSPLAVGGQFVAQNGVTSIGTDIFAQGAGANYSVRLQDGTEAAGKVLVSQTADGKANWSTQLSGSYGLTGSLIVTGGITGTASFATSASRAITASFANTASFVTPLNQNVIVTGSLNVTTNITSSGLLITGSTTTDLVRITQTGTGNAFVVEDSTSPDTSSFTISNAGDVGIGIAPEVQYKLKASGTGIAAIYGFGGTAGVQGSGTSYGVYGDMDGNNVTGVFGNNSYGVGTSAYGVKGQAVNGVGVAGIGGVIGGRFSVANDNGSPIGVYGLAAGGDNGNGTGVYIGGKFEAGGNFDIPNNYSVQLKDGTEAKGKVLVSQDASGSANWSTRLSGSYEITGSLTVTDKIKGTSSHIDTNALIQASLLYLSNNF